MYAAGIELFTVWMNELRSRPPVSIRSSGKNSPPNRRKNRNPSIRTNSFCVLVQIDSNCQYGLHKKPMWVGVSLNGGNPISHPKMMIFSRKTHGRVGETHHFRKPPHVFTNAFRELGLKYEKLPGLILEPSCKHHIGPEPAWPMGVKPQGGSVGTSLEKHMADICFFWEQIPNMIEIYYIICRTFWDEFGCILLLVVQKIPNNHLGWC